MWTIANMALLAVTLFVIAVMVLLLKSKTEIQKELLTKKDDFDSVFLQNADLTYELEKCKNQLEQRDKKIEDLQDRLKSSLKPSLVPQEVLDVFNDLKNNGYSITRIDSDNVFYRSH